MTLCVVKTYKTLTAQKANFNVYDFKTSPRTSEDPQNSVQNVTKSNCYYECMKQPHWNGGVLGGVLTQATSEMSETYKTEGKWDYT